MTAEDEALVHEAGPVLAGEIEAWVAAFSERLSGEPLATALFADPAVVVRVRRALVAWFQELFSLPYDAAYAGARADIGRTHVRTGMPQHFMVTAMGGIRRDVRRSVSARFATDPAQAARLADALDRVLDLELSLMLGAYRRHSHELAQRTDRALYARRAETRAARAREDAADAARCYLSLQRRARDAAAAERWSTRLAEMIEIVARVPGVPGAPQRPMKAPCVASIADLCARALGQVSVPAHTEVEVVVDPPDARVVVHEEALRSALEELLQSAVNRDPGGFVRLEVTSVADGGLLVEVLDGGPRWPDDARTVEDALSRESGAPAACAELAVELHGGTLELVRPPGGGAGVRMRLRAIVPEAIAS
jgi:signal transduction histidine kinase